jgi:hypothetical protein
MGDVDDLAPAIGNEGARRWKTGDRIPRRDARRLVLREFCGASGELGCVRGVIRRFVRRQRDEHEVASLPDRGIPHDVAIGRPNVEVRDEVAAFEDTGHCHFAIIANAMRGI